MPEEKVDVAAEVFNNDPPEIVMPFEEASPAATMGPTKVEELLLVTAKLVVVELVVVALVATNPKVVAI